MQRGLGDFSLVCLGIRMNTEFIACSTVLWCVATYWLGGQELPLVNRGFKWIRRYLLPIGVFLGFLALKILYWKVVVACIFLGAALHLGYQNKVWKYALIGFCVAIPRLILGFHWTFFLPVIFHTLFGYLSLRDNKFRWGYVALLMGSAIGICYLSAT